MLVKKQIADFRVFGFTSLDVVWLDLSIDFIWKRLYKFCSYKNDCCPDLDREFYANLYVNKWDEDFDDSIAKSKVNGVDVCVDEDLSKLCNRGKKCTV